MLGRLNVEFPGVGDLSMVISEDTGDGLAAFIGFDDGESMIPRMMLSDVDGQPMEVVVDDEGRMTRTTVDTLTADFSGGGDEDCMDVLAESPVLTANVFTLEQATGLLIENAFQCPDVPRISRARYDASYNFTITDSLGRTDDGFISRVPCCGVDGPFCPNDLTCQQ